MFERGGAVDVVQFFCLVDDGFDAGTFEEGDFADDVLVGLLFGGEIVVGHVSDCLEAVRKGDVRVRVVFASEPFEYLLVLVVSRAHVDVYLDLFGFGSVFGGDVVE